MNNLKLLLIDDDPISNFLTKKVVEKANINADIIIYDNAANALSLFENFIDINEIPDAIFLDLNMPIMNGWEFIEDFSRLDDEVIAKVSLFILSASDNHYDISTAARYSFIKKYISKPIAIKEVESLFSSHKCLEV